MNVIMNVITEFNRVPVGQDGKSYIRKLGAYSKYNGTH